MDSETSNKRGGGGSFLRAIPAAIDKCEPIIEWLIRICGWSAILFVLAIFAFVFKEAWPPIAPRPRVNVVASSDSGVSESTKLVDGANWTVGDSQIGYVTRKQGSGFDGTLSFAGAKPGKYQFVFEKDVFLNARSTSGSGVTAKAALSGEVPSEGKAHLIGTKVTLVDLAADAATAGSQKTTADENSNEIASHKVVYQIVEPDQEDIERGRISTNSSIYKVLRGKQSGDTVDLEISGRMGSYKIDGVEYSTRILNVSVESITGDEPPAVTVVLTTGWLNVGEFLTSENWRPDSETNPQYGILALIVGTSCITVLSTLLSVPLGLGAAVYLSEFCDGKLRETLKIVIELLAAIPSIVWGFVGVVVLGPILIKYTGQPIGVNILNGSIILALMSVPIIVSIGEDSLKAVPDSFREAAVSLGASRWEVVYKVLFPAAKNGLLAAVLLGVGRAIGETMAVLLCTGHSVRIPSKVTDPIRTMTATIASELGEAVKGGQHYQVLFLIGVVLFALTFLVNLTADLVVKGVKAQND